MKTLVNTIFAAALITVSTMSMATGRPEVKPGKAKVNLSTADLAIDHYVAVTTAGSSAGLQQLFAEDFSQKMQGERSVTYGRGDVIKFLKKQKGEQLNCKVDTQIIEASADCVVAKIMLRFENFIRKDLVTLVREGDNWKVSESISSYK